MNINEKGFMLLSAVFLTMILSFIAMMTLQTMIRIKNSDAALKLHAINLANEQFAMIESLAAQGSLDTTYSFLGEPEDLKNYGLYKKDSEENKQPTEFEVTSEINDKGTLRKVMIIVTWKDKKLEFEKIVRLKD